MKLVLIRHGESQWNKENRFGGWTDTDLTKKGVAEAKRAGQILKEQGYFFDAAFTSVLKRAIRTAWIILDVMDLIQIPIYQSWRLNEKYYGALQGLNKSETAAKFGEEQVLIWRRSYSIQPPAVTKTDKRYPGNDPKYKDLDTLDLPRTESLRDVTQRVLPYWCENIVPIIKANKRVIISAHGNSLRALVKHIDNINDQELLNLNIPTGIPLIYELDDNLKPKQHHYLGDPADVEKAINVVINQGKVLKS